VDKYGIRNLLVKSLGGRDEAVLIERDLPQPLPGWTSACPPPQRIRTPADPLPM
jgi:hypothetical protein